MIKKVMLIPAAAVTLPGLLMLPDQPRAIILFSHGAGSSRNSPRNQMVASKLYEAGFGSLLFDLLTPEEDLNYHNRFNIRLLSGRLVAVATWLSQSPGLGRLPQAFFGASTGAAAALQAAAVLPSIYAVVCRGGRPDLAEDCLPEVKVPVLLVVGSMDPQVIELNREAYKMLPGIKQLRIIEGAGHLFEEAGKLHEVCGLAVEWFTRYLPSENVHSKKKNYVS